jgi:transposase
MWEQFAAAPTEVKDPRGAPPGLDDRRFVEAVLYLARTGLLWARFAGRVWRMERGIHALSTLGESRGLATAMGGVSARRDAGAARRVRRQHQHSCASARGWGTQKNGADQALGRSRGGLTTKLHAASTDEHTAVALALTACERHDLIGCDAVYAQAREGGMLTRLTADRAYDAGEVRTRLIEDEVEGGIPPRKNRRRLPHCSRPLYRRRHKIENWFRKIQDFRRLATRYEKLAACYLALVHLVSVVILLRSFVNTP